MTNQIAFAGFNNVTLTSLYVHHSDKREKFYKRLCFQLNDKSEKDLSENTNLLKLFPDKMHSNYLRIDSSLDGIYLNGKQIEFYPKNCQLFTQVGKLLDKIQKSTDKFTYSKRYFNSDRALKNMVFFINGEKDNKSSFERIKKNVPKLEGIADNKSKISNFANVLSEFCQDFCKRIKFLN